MRAAIYTRFSTEQQQSTEMQIAKCREYAEANHIDIVAVYSDEGMTGTNMLRDSFQQLLYDAQNKRFDAIIIYDITRGSRDVADWFNFRKLMSQLNIKVISTTEKLGDILDPNDYLTEMLTVGIGHRAVLETRKKSIDGKTTQAKHGLFQGGFSPLGYDIVNQEYVVNEHEAEAVRLIFSLYAGGESYNYIVDELTKRGYKGKRGQAIGKNSIHAILKNDRYIGVYSWNRNINRKMKRWVGIKNANPNKVEIQNRIPCLIDEATWEKVRRRMNDNTRNASNKAKEEYILSGLLICDKCGARFVGHTSTNQKGIKTRYYTCGNKYRTHNCDAKNINADFIEAELALQLRAWLTTENIREFAEEVERKHRESLKLDKVTLYNELRELDRKISRAVKILLDDDIDAVKEELLKMQTRKSEIESLLDDEPDAEIVDAETIYKIMTADLENADNVDAKTLIRRYIREVHVLNDEYTVIGSVSETKKDGLAQNKVVFMDVESLYKGFF